MPGADQFRGGPGLLYSLGFCPMDYSWVAVAGFMFFILVFAPGAGPVPWVINAEIYPLWSRSVAASITTMTNWSCNYVVSKLFLTITKSLSTWGTFLIFAIVCLLGAVFTFCLVPETKDRTLEEIGKDPWAPPTIPDTATPSIGLQSPLPVMPYENKPDMPSENKSEKRPEIIRNITFADEAKIQKKSLSF
ncbi:proton myo-inositol cotransporter [Elysia marginata]|uniref:Proton myo-inositol cotransporter n=1 Tax=Elysia marginata TaxID=1093978 RepID=A0AAV4HMY4_9GAST|nr:proton myo-inositol cotransporter [Elysia marginata]